MNKISVLLILCLTAIFTQATPQKPKLENKNPQLKGDLIIFHAGSLAVPMKEIAQAFKKENPDINIMMEA
ncbi:MAG TPA: tungstate ABC transporter substrate-binding protein WtpA, partial [Bacteroidales bacterium]|nr:tungstate ABC transporter substrate-binding protein WtpA [Bacteroidales bacterium]